MSSAVVRLDAFMEQSGNLGWWGGNCNARKNRKWCEKRIPRPSVSFKREEIVTEKNRAIFGIKLTRMSGVFRPVVSVQSRIFDADCAYVIRRKYDERTVCSSCR